MWMSPGYMCPPLAGIVAASLRFLAPRIGRFGDNPFAVNQMAIFLSYILIH